MLSVTSPFSPLVSLVNGSINAYISSSTFFTYLSGDISTNLNCTLNGCLLSRNLTLPSSVKDQLVYLPQPNGYLLVNRKAEVVLFGRSPVILNGLIIPSSIGISERF